jgi:hypothetical protein
MLSHSPSFAALVGTALAARYAGGAAVAIGEGLAGAVSGSALAGAAIGAGAVAGAGAFVQNPGHALGGSGWEAAKRLWNGSPAAPGSNAPAPNGSPSSSPSGHAAQSQGGATPRTFVPGGAATGAAAPGTPWNHEVGTVPAVGGGAPKAFVAHWTGGGGSIAGVENTLRQRGLGVEYVMDRNGNIKQTGGPGSAHIRNENRYGTALGRQLGLKSSNTVGMEVIADPTNPRHPLPYTDAQLAAFPQFAREHYPHTPFYGHGEIQSSKQRGEGLALANAVRADRVAHGEDPTTGNRTRANTRRTFGHPNMGRHPATLGQAQTNVTVVNESGSGVVLVPH